MPPSTPATPRLAATILLLRDTAAGLEVLMLGRHRGEDMFSGALIFPGGKLAAGDQDSRVRARCSGAEGLSDERLALRVAAIREAFEESGLLLARPRGEPHMVSAARAASLGEQYRKALDTEAIGIAQMLEAEDLVLACEGLVPYAHWITPVHAPKRFDTHFYLASAPDEQIAVHDGTETIDSQWLRPADALADRAAGRRTIVLATFCSLQKLDRSRTTAEALAAARAERIVTVLPEVVERPNGRMVVIPAEAGYELNEYPARDIGPAR